MEPISYRRATLSDLLDRVLDKGIILNADIVISLANIPLIGVNLRAAIAGMETMVKYGMMRDYDMEKNMWLVSEQRSKEAEKQEARSRKLEKPSSIQHPASSLQLLASSFQHPASRLL